MKPPEPCPVFSSCWCSVAGRENNPHCKLIDLPAGNAFFDMFIVVAIIVFIFNKYFKKK